MLTAAPRGRAWIELDRAALIHNVLALRSLLPQGCALMPVVKANAYGHGAALIARALQDVGLDAFCVATAEEGAALRQAGIGGMVLVLGYTGPEDFPLLADWDLTQAAASLSHARQMGDFGRPLAAHLAIDTGMHRLGVPWDDAGALQAACAVKNLRVTGAFTHLAEAGSAFTEIQTGRFYAAVDRLRSQGFPIAKVHLLGSYGILHCPQAAGDYARPGIALYGVPERREDGENCPVSLRPVLSLKGRITAVHRLAPGEGAGYDLAFTAKRQTVLAAAAIGYADGLPRCLGEGRGRALVHGVSVPIAGRICMDQCLLDVTDAPEAEPGDVAVFIGGQGREYISACELAEAAGTITNEILSRLGPRLGRVMI